MMEANSKNRVVIIGGGIIGLTAARELQGAGFRVTVLERKEPGGEASRAAAGILAPRLEAAPDSELLELGLASKALYPEFVHELEEETGVDLDLRLNGVLSPLTQGPRSLVPEGAEQVSGSALRTLEPGLNPNIKAALFYPDEGSVDNRALLQALLHSCKIRRVKVLADTSADDVLTASGCVCGVRAGGRTFEADAVINCAGAWAGELKVPGAATRVRPVKGQMLMLRSAQAPEHTLYSPEVYLVPRKGGRVIVGTTVEERGFNKDVEAWAVSYLLGGAAELCPHLSRARVEELWAGLRPRGESEVPEARQVGPDGYFVAVGHYRNGILLAPLTARIVCDLLKGGDAAPVTERERAQRV